MESSMRPAMILALLVAFTTPALVVSATSLAQAEPAAPVPQKPSTKERSEEPAHGEFVKGTLKTRPRDANFGQRAARVDERFRSERADLAAVDRRRQISSMADRNILAPMAQTPAEGTLSYSNYNILGNYLTYAPSDEFAMTAGMIIPSAEGDFFTSVSGKYKLYESRDWLVSVLPFGAYANGVMEVDSYQFGLGTGLLADLNVTDSIVLTGGALGFATLAAGYERFSDDCTRAEFGQQRCTVETTNIGLPAGGHWVAATLGASWFLTDSFALNFEYILGGSWGTFFGVEDDASTNDLDARRDRFERPDFASGFPHRQGPTFSTAGTWSNGSVGLQFALVLIRRGDNPDTFVTDESQEHHAFPMFSGAFHF